jgi:nucleoid-associated protein YgaU
MNNKTSMLSSWKFFPAAFRRLSAIAAVTAMILCRGTFGAGAAYDDFGAGARVLAVGGAVTAVGDDIYASALNPAGLAYIKRGQVAFEYGRLHLNLTDGSNLFNGFFAAGYPFIKSEIVETRVDLSTSAPSVAAAFSSSTEVSTNSVTGPPSDGIKTGIRRTLSSAARISYRSMGLAGHYSESVITVGYARFVHKRMALGLAVKSLTDGFISDEYLERSPVFDYGKMLSKTSYTGDAGLIWNPSPRFFVGMAALDFTEPDIGYLESEPLSATYRFGMGMRKADVRFGCDLSYAPRAKNTELSTGFEGNLSSLAALRGGLVYGRLENADSWRVTAGVGFEISDSIALDYAVVYPLAVLKNTYGSHWMSFVYRFGKVSSEEMEPGTLERAYQELAEEKYSLETRLARTESEKRQLEEVLIEEASSRIRERIRQAKESSRAELAARRETDPSRAAAVTGVISSRTHVVRRGDTLQSLADKYYKDSRHWIEIYNANRADIGRGGALRPNQVLVIPPNPSERPSPAAAPAPVRPAEAPSAVAPEMKTVSPSTESVSATAVDAPAPVEAPVLKPSAPPAPKPATPPAKERSSGAKPSPRSHVVGQGENLRSIAAKYYNDPEKWRVILDANKDKIVRGQVRPGVELSIP